MKSVQIAEVTFLQALQYVRIVSMSSIRMIMIWNCLL